MRKLQDGWMMDLDERAAENKKVSTAFPNRQGGEQPELLGRGMEQGSPSMHSSRRPEASQTRFSSNGTPFLGCRETPLCGGFGAFHPTRREPCLGKS